MNKIMNKYFNLKIINKFYEIIDCSCLILISNNKY